MLTLPDAWAWDFWLADDGARVVRGPDETWHMFYTDATDAGGETVQVTCLATSPDLVTWARDPANPLLRADPRWYEVLGESWPGENWRDPWVYPDRVRVRRRPRRDRRRLVGGPAPLGGAAAALGARGRVRAAGGDAARARR